jgi:hypothetical protein
VNTRGIPRRSRHLRRHVNSITCRLRPVRRFTRAVRPPNREVVCVSFRKNTSGKSEKKGETFTLGGLQELEFFALFAQHLHVEVTVGFDPVLVDLDGESANESQGTLLVGKCGRDRATLTERLKDVHASEMFVTLSWQAIEGQNFINVLFHPRAGRGYFCCQWQGLGGFLGVAPIVEPAQFNEAFIGDFARHVVERIPQEMHIVRQPPGSRRTE